MIVCIYSYTWYTRYRSPFDETLRPFKDLSDLSVYVPMPSLSLTCLSLCFPQALRCAFLGEDALMDDAKFIRSLATSGKVREAPGQGDTDKDTHKRDKNKR